MTAEVKDRYWEIPRGPLWVAPPVLAGTIALAATGALDWPIRAAVVAGAAAAGSWVGAYIAARLPSWNRARRERLTDRVRAEFRAQSEMLESDFDRATEALEDLRQAVVAKSYPDYLLRAGAVDQVQALLTKDFSVVFGDMPSVVSELGRAAEALVREVEEDPLGASVYEPSILERIEGMKARAAAGNILDCYRASKDLEEMLGHLSRRNRPFDLSVSVRRLKDEWQACRDHFLADPRHEAVWREIQEKDERLEEERRHNEAMEEAAGARAEAARQQVALDAERNRLLRQQRNAERAIAVGTAATTYYTRKGANAARETAKRSGRSSGV